MTCKGITFFALLRFPAITPLAHPVFNRFEGPFQLQPSPSPLSSPSPADTDLYLSLESLKGRKYLQVRGIVDLPEGEVFDGAEDGGGVHVYVVREKARSS